MEKKARKIGRDFNKSEIVAAVRIHKRKTLLMQIPLSYFILIFFAAFLISAPAVLAGGSAEATISVDSTSTVAGSSDHSTATTTTVASSPTSTPSKAKNVEIPSVGESILLAGQASSSEERTKYLTNAAVGLLKPVFAVKYSSSMNSDWKDRKGKYGSDPQYVVKTIFENFKARFFKGHAAKMNNLSEVGGILSEEQKKPFFSLIKKAGKNSIEELFKKTIPNNPKMNASLFQRMKYTIYALVFEAAAFWKQAGLNWEEGDDIMTEFEELLDRFYEATIENGPGELQYCTEVFGKQANPSVRKETGGDGDDVDHALRVMKMMFIFFVIWLVNFILGGCGCRKNETF